MQQIFRLLNNNAKLGLSRRRPDGACRQSASQSAYLLSRGHNVALELQLTTIGLTI